MHSFYKFAKVMENEELTAAAQEWYEGLDDIKKGELNNLAYRAIIRGHAFRGPRWLKHEEQGMLAPVIKELAKQFPEYRPDMI